MMNRSDSTGVIDRRHLVKKLYQKISNLSRPLDTFSIQMRINEIRHLEKLMRTEFRNSRDMRRKIEDYQENYDARKMSVSRRIKKARKKKRLTQRELAELMGYKSHVPITYFEKGLRYPPDKVFHWLEQEGM